MVKGFDFPNKSQIKRKTLSKSDTVRAIKGRELCTRAFLRIVIIDRQTIYIQKDMHSLVSRKFESNHKRYQIKVLKGSHFEEVYLRVIVSFDFKIFHLGVMIDKFIS